jgi:hypothetical protein
MEFRSEDLVTDEQENMSWPSNVGGLLILPFVESLDPSMQSTQNDGYSNPVVFMSNTVLPN